MDRLVARLERRFGRYAIENFTYYLVAAQVIVLVLSIVQPALVDMLRLDTGLVLQGQVWRLVTWLAIPVSLSPFWALFAIYWMWMVGSALEAEWGSFKYEVYWLIGILGTTLFGFAVRVPVGNEHLVGSLFLAFATLWPDYIINVFFILPIPVKYLALVDGAYILASIGMYQGWQKVVPLIAVANYLLFFTPTLIGLLSSAQRHAADAPRRWKFHRDSRAVSRPRRCALCGITDENPATEFRICGCDKCKTPTEFCLEHAYKH